jgi:hypothetical protein
MSETNADIRYIKFDRDPTLDLAIEWRPRSGARMLQPGLSLQLRHARA